MNAAHDVRTPAEIYEEMFVPALFEQWAPVLADAARIGRGEHVLDIACGTGVLARAALRRMGLEGRVVGLDANADMLAVARRKSGAIEWREGRAEALPFPDQSFDAVVSQFGLMFFEDRTTALREMMRVLRAGGQLAVAVCDAVEHSPGYATFAELLERLFGTRIADAFRAPFVLGDPERLLAICREAGIADASVIQRTGTVRFSSIRMLVSTERACVWTLGGLLDENQFAELAKAAEHALESYVDGSGAIIFDMPALFITARR
jgi:ubiquinone/menaquinone biosynthesis C-methylase UbiE